jgi:transposase InsO family protein
VDNSMIESFWSTMQRESPRPAGWQTREQLGTAIFEWIEAWYNPRRRHTALGIRHARPRTSSSPRTPPRSPRHDHHTTRVRRTGSGSGRMGIRRDRRSPHEAFGRHFPEARIL